ncbi:transposase [Streptomyces sp. CA-251387]|uniref:transposase n=1 Tax=Streptomyces sp. CA-251387 TaxID=3240064 RepID=UPI003D9169F7
MSCSSYGLSDRQAAEAVRCRIDFKYAMAMKLNDPGFHHSVPADFRPSAALAIHGVGSHCPRLPFDGR